MPNEITEEWLSSRDSLKQLENLQIPRCVLPDKKFENFQLHLFTDASEKAYAATVYSRFQSSDGSISVKLPVAKTRVAPCQGSQFASVGVVRCTIGNSAYQDSH